MDVEEYKKLDKESSLSRTRDYTRGIVVIFKRICCTCDRTFYCAGNCRHRRRSKDDFIDHCWCPTCCKDRLDTGHFPMDKCPRVFATNLEDAIRIMVINGL